MASAAQCSLDVGGTTLAQHLQLQGGGGAAERVQEKTRKPWRFCASRCRHRVGISRHVATASTPDSSKWLAPTGRERGGDQIQRPGMLQAGSAAEDALTGRQRLGRSGGYGGISEPKTQPRRRPLGIRAGGTGSSFGTLFRVTTFGESHGGGVGCVIDGCPPQIPLSETDMQVELDRRRPGQSRITTPRKESDTCKILSGVGEGVTLGTPICVFVPNTDQRGGDYSDMELKYRPSHADATYDFKYGVRAVQGGGRSSARETIGRVAAGAVAKKFLRMYSGTEILAFVSSVHNVELPEDAVDLETLTMEQIESNIVRCPDPEAAEKMINAVDAVRVCGDSCGGVVTCIARNVPKGLGMPVFDKLEAELGKAMMSLPATKGFEVGSGFEGTKMTGSDHNDPFYIDEEGKVRTRTNRSGGIQGGISNGEMIVMRIAFKPTSTISINQKTVTRSKVETELRARGRHDPCVVPRAVPMVEAMAALVLADQLMQQYAQCQILAGAMNPPQQHIESLPARNRTAADEAALYSES